MPQAPGQGSPAGLRRLRQAQEVADSRTHDGALPRRDSMPELPELTAPTDQLPIWLSPGFTMPLPPDAVVAASRGPRPLVMCLFGLAFLGAAAAAWVGLRAWRRSCQRQRQRQQHRHDLESLLWARRQQRQLAYSDGYQAVEAAEPGGGARDLKDLELETGWGQGSSSGSKHGHSSRPAGTAAAHARSVAAPAAATLPAAAAPAATEGAPPRPHRAASSERRTRLAALLAAHLGTRRSRSLGKLPPEALPAALTHQLSPAGPGAAVQPKQRRRRRHRERKPGGSGSDSKPKRSLQGGPEQRRPPAPEELQLALQQQLSPPRASGRHHGAAAAAAAAARRLPPPPGTPLLASQSQVVPVVSPPGYGVAVGQRSVGGSSSSSGAASLLAAGSSRAAGGRGSAAGCISRSSTELAGSSSTVESVLDWLSSGEVCGDTGGEQAQQAQQPGHTQQLEHTQQPGQPSPLAGLQFATDGSQRLQELGSGPHGEMFRGRLNGMDVAIKVAEPQPGFDAVALQPWVTAVQAAPHPHILPLTAAGTKDALLLLVAELVRGRSLRAALQRPEQRQQLAWAARGREVALAVAEALSHLHGTLRMAHGNLTASNVLLGDSGTILVTDAGLSALLSSPPAAGGVRAAAPQVPAAHAALADDVHCLGELLAAMLAPQSGAAPDCPAAVAEMIQACRSPDPQQRPTAAHVLRCLQHDAGGPAAWSGSL